MKRQFQLWCLSLMLLPRLLLGQERRIAVKVECVGTGADQCRDVQKQIGPLEPAVVTTLSETIRHFMFTPSSASDSCGVLQINVARDSTEPGWHLDMKVFRYRTRCPAAPQPDSAPTLRLKTFSSTDGDFAKNLAKSLAGQLQENKDFAQTLTTMLGDAIPLSVDAAFQDINGSKPQLNAKVIVKPPPNIDDSQPFLNAIYNIRNVDASAGPVVFRFTGMGCAPETAPPNLIIDAQSFRVVPALQAKDPTAAGREFSAADVRDVRAMTHNLVYLLVKGESGDCSAFEVPPKSIAADRKSTQDMSSASR